MDPKQLRALSKVCRENGISYLKTPDVEVKFEFPSIPDKVYLANKAERQPNEPDFSEEDALMWSSAGLPENP